MTVSPNYNRKLIAQKRIDSKQTFRQRTFTVYNVHIRETTAVATNVIGICQHPP